MMMQDSVGHLKKSDYSPVEEFINAFTHGVGVVFSIVMLLLMLNKATASSIHLTTFQLAGIVVYGFSLFLMFLSSTLYHTFSNTAAKYALKRLDHCAIFAIIAGTYTPLLLISLNTYKAIVLFWIVWIIALLGIGLKLFFVHRFQRASLFTYLGLGWLSVFVIKDYYYALAKPALYLILLGGVLYSIGTVFYAAKKYHYTHAVWHCFVLAAAICHALAIYWYVI